jgi:hypothetical protein
VETNREPAVFVSHGIDHIHLRIKREADMIGAPTIVSQPLVIMFKDEDGKILCHLYPDQCDHRHLQTIRDAFPRNYLNNVKRTR